MKIRNLAFAHHHDVVITLLRIPLNMQHQDHFQIRAWFLGVGIDGSAQEFQTTVTRVKGQSWFFDKCKQLHFFSLHDRTWTTTSSYSNENKCQQIGHALDGQDAYVSPSPYGCYQVSLGAVPSAARVSVTGVHMEFDLIVKEGGVGANIANNGQFFADLTHELRESSLVTGAMRDSTRHVGCSNTPAVECAAVKQLFCNPSSPTLGEDQCDKDNCRFCPTNHYAPAIGNVCLPAPFGQGDGQGVVVVHGRSLRGSEETRG